MSDKLRGKWNFNRDNPDSDEWFGYRDGQKLVGPAGTPTRARALALEYEAGEEGGAGGAGAQEPDAAGTAAPTLEDEGDGPIPRPARTAAFWHELAARTADELNALDEKSPRRAPKERTLRALEALGRAFDAGELPESLFGLSERAQVMRLVNVEETPTDAPFEEVIAKAMDSAGIDTPEKYARARTDLYTIMVEWGGSTDTAEASHDEQQGARLMAAAEAANPRPAPASDFLKEVGEVIDEGIRLIDAGAADPFGLRDLPLDIVNTMAGTQTRVALDESAVKDFKENMLAGALFPAGVVYYDGKAYYLARGFHRHEAARRAGRLTFPFEVRRGGRREAFLDSLADNTSHGVRLTYADKRNKVLMALGDPELAKLSNHKLADATGTSHTFVGTVRRELTGSSSGSEVVVHRGEQTYTMKPGARPAAPPPAEVDEGLPAEAPATSTTEPAGRAPERPQTEAVAPASPPAAAREAAPASAGSTPAATADSGFDESAYTFNIMVRAGRNARRGIVVSGRAGDDAPVFLNDYTLADLEPAPPALRGLLDAMRTAYDRKHGRRKAAPAQPARKAAEKPAAEKPKSPPKQRVAAKPKPVAGVKKKPAAPATAKKAAVRAAAKRPAAKGDAKAGYTVKVSGGLSAAQKAAVKVSVPKWPAPTANPPRVSTKRTVKSDRGRGR